MFIRKVAELSIKTIDKISWLAGIISIVFLVAMMLLTTIDVCLRYCFNAPISGSVELTQYSMIVAGFSGLAWCALKGGHMKIGLLVDRLPSHSQNIIDCISIFLSLTVVPLVAWQGFVQANNAFMDKNVSSILEIPAFPFYTVVGLSFTLLFAVLLQIFIELLRKVIKWSVRK